jgi:hypothetical protein
MPGVLIPTPYYPGFDNDLVLRADLTPVRVLSQECNVCFYRHFPSFDG